MAPSSSRTLWQGAISFGLVRIPVTLHSSTAGRRRTFSLLDKRTTQPVGNQRTNKATGGATASRGQEPYLLQETVRHSPRKGGAAEAQDKPKPRKKVA